MVKNNGKIAKTSKQIASQSKDRKHRRSLTISERGITDDNDLQTFSAAMIADINAGRMDLKEGALLSSFVGKMISMANLQFRVGAFGASRRKASLQLVG